MNLKKKGWNKMAIKDQGMHKPKKLPRCPKCNSKNTVGAVVSVSPFSNTACKAYFCSNCLTEWINNNKKKTSQTAICKGQ